MHDSEMGRITEAIYDAAVEPRLWSDVVGIVKKRFNTPAVGFYGLDSMTRSLRPMEVTGIGGFYLRTFNACFYTDDNPCTRSGPLHRPGVVRTDQRLTAYFRDPDVLLRSQYYNEWMRPQDLTHTMGATLLEDADVSFNFTLLRPSDVGAYRNGEIAAFARVCSHLKRAMRIATRLETVMTQRRMTAEALEHLQHAVAFVDFSGRLLHCNQKAEALFRRGDALRLRNARIVAVDEAAQNELAALMKALAGAPSQMPPPRTIVIRRRGEGRPILVSAIRLSGSAHGGASSPTLLLMITDSSGVQRADALLYRRLYQLTNAEAALAQHLATGLSVRRAAAAAGMTYETARWYLKILFQKTGTRRQAELIYRLREDATHPLRGP